MRQSRRAISAADLQPRHLRPGPSATLPGDRARAGRATARPVGADPLRLADHRQLQLPHARRFRPHSRRDQAEGRRLPAAQPGHRPGRILSMRGKIIRHTAEAFEPHIFLVDKEPLGLRGEVRDTLALLKARGTPTGAGLARRHGRAGTTGRGMGAQERRAGARRSSTTPSGSTACRRSATRWRASRCRRRSRARCAIPATCGGSRRRGSGRLSNLPRRSARALPAGDHRRRRRRRAC